MMSQVDERYTVFNNVAKLVNKKDISVNRVTLERYRSSIIPAYNDFLKFVDVNYHRVKQSDQYKLDTYLERARGTFIKCLDSLKCTHDLPNDLKEQITDLHVSQLPGAEHVEDLVAVVKEEIQTNESVSRANADDNVNNEAIVDGNENGTNETVNENGTNGDVNENTEERNNDENNDGANDDEENDDDREPVDFEDNSEDYSENQLNMAMTPIELFNAVNRQFKHNYGGDPLGLTAFIDSVELLAEFADTVPLRASLLKYIKAKLEGRAREFVTPEVNTIEALIEVLKTNIFPERSEVIEGRITALRYAYAKQEEFAAKAEELSDALRRTLIIEGMTAVKANEISVKKTIELCRKSTNSELVKAVLAATPFKSPKEVIAKLITESDTHVKEQQILRCQRPNRGNGNNRRGRDRGGHRPNNNNNYSNANSNQWRPNNNYRGRGGQRGRGGGRPYNNSGNNYQNNNWQNNNNNRGQGGPNIRVAQSGNESGPQPPPQHVHIGAPNQMNPMFQ